MTEKYTIISLMGDKASAIDTYGLKREFIVSELINMAMNGVEFITEPEIHQEIFRIISKEIFISKK